MSRERGPRPWGPMLAAALLAPLALAAAGGAATTHTVRLTDRAPYMHPQTLEIAVGDEVVWVNEGPEMVHTVIDEDLFLFSDDVALRGRWGTTFEKAGIYPYLCARHHFMRGTIVVRNPDGSTDSPLEYPYQAAFREFVVPTRQAVPRMVIASPLDESIWFTEGGGDFYLFEDIPAQNKVARLRGDGHFVEYATPTPGRDGRGVGVDSLVMDAQGNVWFTERLTNRIGKLEPSGRILEFEIPTPDGHPLGIDLDAQGRIWYAQRYGNRIGWMSPRGEFHEIELPEPDSEPRTVFVDSRQRVWYTARTANEIGYYDIASGEIHRLKIPTELARPTGIAETSDGSIFFVEMVGNKIAKVVGDQVVEYPLPTKFAAPFKIVADGDDNLWFTEVFGNAIGKLDPRTERITEYKIPTPDSQPGGIDVDRRGRIWFTEQRGNKIGMFDPAVARQIAAEAGPPASAPEEAAAAAPRSIADFDLPSPGAGPGNDLIEDDEGWLWLNQVFGNKISAFHPQREEWREFELPTPNSMPVGLARHPDGSFWAPLFRNSRLARLDPSTGAVRELELPTDGALPSSVAVDEHGSVWVTELGANRIARFEPLRERFEEFELPRGESSPLMILADHQGSLWVSASEENGNYLARFDLAGERFEAFELPTAGASPTGLLRDAAGDIWVAEGGAGKIARFDAATGDWEEFAIPAEEAEPVKLAQDAAGRIWLTDGGGLGDPGGNRLAVFDPSTRHFELIPMKRAGAKPRGILAASDGHIYFTQQNANLLSRLRPEEW